MPSICTSADIMNGTSAVSGASFASTAAADGPCSAISASPSLRIQGHALRQARLDMGVVGVLHGGVDDEVEPALVAGSADAGDHEIVEDAAILG